MKVLITLNKMNTGRVQLSCIKSTNEGGGVGTAYTLPPFNPNAMAEVEAILGNMGVDEEIIAATVSQIRQAGLGGVVKVQDRDVPDDILRENGFSL